MRSRPGADGASAGAGGGSDLGAAGVGPGRLLRPVLVFGAAIAARRGEHLAVELISDLLPPPARRAVIWLAGALSAALLVASVWFTIGLVQNQIRTGMTSYALNLPLWWYSAAVPLGFALVLVRYVQALVRGPERDG